MMQKLILLGVCILLFINNSFGQDFSTTRIDSTHNGIGIKDYLLKIEKETGVDFIFDENSFGNFPMNGITFNQHIFNYLPLFFKPLGLKVVIVKPNVALIVSSDLVSRFNSPEQYIVLKAEDGKKVEFQGRLIDDSTGDDLIGGQVIIEGTTRGAISDALGKYAITLENSTTNIYVINMSYTGFKEASYVVALSKYGDDKKMYDRLAPVGTELQGIIITTDRVDKNISDKLTGVEAMGIETIRMLPTFMGEIDPIRGLTTLPGISTAGEPSSGYNVRGGDLGQNLVRQDGAVIVNPSHLFGFYSAFNPDHIDDVTLIKGGGNAKYGTRVSSVMDVKLKNGNLKKFHVTGGVGLVSSKLMVEGPIVKNKSSFIIGGRGSYTNWLLHKTGDINLSQSSAQFGDLTLKLFQSINDKNFITISGYSSFDSFNLVSDSLYHWTTNNVSMQWGHTFSDKTYAHLTFARSQYLSKLTNSNEIENFEYQNGMNITSLSYNIETNLSDTKILYTGIEAIYTEINPGELQNLSTIGNVKPFSIDKHQAIETALFAHYDWDITDKFAVSAGLRYSQFYRLGPGTIYEFDYNVNNARLPTLLDTLQYESGELIDFQHGLEPRISFRYSINNSTSLKTSFYRTYQYIHLISNTTTSSPLDYWLSGGPNIKPEIGDQFSFGVFKNLNNNAYETSVEGFYKLVDNSIDYIEGADLQLNEAIEGVLIGGKSTSYGIETLVKKQSGELTGWLSYTYSRSLKQFDSNYELLTINDGEYYSSQYDQPHNVSLVLSYIPDPQWIFSMNFSYATGRPITIPVSKFSYDGRLAVLTYSKRNEYRMPDYHRLDLSVTLKSNQINKRYNSEWVLSVINVYGRANAYALYFNKWGQGKKMSILGQAFPSLSYNFNF